MHMLAGKLEKGAVLKAICSGFEETTEPGVCLSGGEFFLLLFFWKLNVTLRHHFDAMMKNSSNEAQNNRVQS